MIKTILMLIRENFLQLFFDLMVLGVLVFAPELGYEMWLRIFAGLCLLSILYTKAAGAYYIGRRHVHEERIQEQREEMEERLNQRGWFN